MDLLDSSKVKNLIGLDLSDCKSVPNSFSWLIDGLVNNSTLKYLSLYNSRIGLQKLSLLANALETTSIQTLDISCNEIILTNQGFKNCKSLLHLYFRENPQSPTSLPIFLENLPSNLQTLDISQCELTDECVSSLCIFLEQHNLQTLNLSSNCFKMIYDLIEVLSRNSSLTSLNLSMNDLAGMEEFQRVFRKNTTLRKLNLARTEMSDKVALKLGNSFKTAMKTTALTDINLDLNYISKEAIVKELFGEVAHLGTQRSPFVQNYWAIRNNH